MRSWKTGYSSTLDFWPYSVYFTYKPDRYDVENIHVGGAHLGLGFNPRVLVALADRLAQPEGQWRPFKPALWMKPLYHNWYPDWLVHGEENPIGIT